MRHFFAFRLSHPSHAWFVCWSLAVDFLWTCVLGHLVSFSDLELFCLGHSIFVLGDIFHMSL